MVTWASALDCRPYVVSVVTDDVLQLTDYFGPPPGTVGHGAQSRLVEPQDPGVGIKPHYHVQDQYQVFVDTVGQFGSRELTAPISVQYADAFTPYGPARSSDGRGMRFVTVRMRPDPGPRLLRDPEARAARRGKGGRQLMWNLPEHGDGEPGTVQTIEAFDDGVGVHRLKLEPRTSARGHALGAGALQMNIVIGGSLIEGGRTHPRLTHVLVEPSDEVPEFTAAYDGADILVLEFRHPVEHGREGVAAAASGDLS
jgi:hypothetical protein